MENTKHHFLLVLCSWILLGMLSLVHANPGNTNLEHTKTSLSSNLSKEDQLLLKKQFIELPSSPLRAENFQGIPVNDAHSELFMYQNKFILLNFWATWCMPCLKELPDMERLHQQLGKQGLVILAVAMGESKQKVKKFLERRNLTFPIMADPDMEISQLYGVQNLPITFLIDRDQTIVGRALGPRQWDNPDLVEFFRKKIKIP